MLWAYSNLNSATGQGMHGIFYSPFNSELSESSFLECRFTAEPCQLIGKAVPPKQKQHSKQQTPHLFGNHFSLLTAEIVFSALTYFP